MKWIEITPESQKMLAFRHAVDPCEVDEIFPIGWIYVCGFGDNSQPFYRLYTSWDEFYKDIRVDRTKIRRILNGFFTDDSGKKPRENGQMDKNWLC